MKLDAALEELGLSALDASPSRVKEAFRARSLKVHPDMGGSTESFLKLSSARDVVSLFASCKPVLLVRPDGTLDHMELEACLTCKTQCRDWCYCVACDGGGCETCGGKGGFSMNGNSLKPKCVQCMGAGVKYKKISSKPNNLKSPPLHGDLLDGKLVVYEALGEGKTFEADSSGVRIHWRVSVEDILAGVACSALGIDTNGAFDPCVPMLTKHGACVRFSVSGVDNIRRLRRFQPALDKIVGMKGVDCAGGLRG